MTRPIGGYLDDIEALVKLHQRELYAYASSEVEPFRLQMMQKRFDELKYKVPALKKLAQLQKVEQIHDFDQAVLLLFQHTVYKSYPMSFLEQGRFAALTKWLAQLTTVDLGAVDASACRFIDEWLDLLERETSLTPIHTTGTSGKLSFIPRDATGIRRLLYSTTSWSQGFGDELDLTLDVDHPDRKRPMIHPGNVKGYYIGNRILDLQLQTISSPDLLDALYDDALSPDVLSLAGRVMAAEARGELDKLKIDQALMERFKTAQARNADRSEEITRFCERVIARYRGQSVLMTGHPPYLFHVAGVIRGQGIIGLYAPDSRIFSSGGSKGVALPDDWKDQVEDTLGARVNFAYSMSELCGTMNGCTRGNYHVPAYLVPFVLNEETGEPLPRTGIQTGRSAFFDTLVENYWGGFVTGDEVTAHWDGGCTCGRQGVYFEPNIRRISDKKGGEDKISCAGVADAQDKAMRFLLSQAEQS